MKTRFIIVILCSALAAAVIAAQNKSGSKSDAAPPAPGTPAPATPAAATPTPKAPSPAGNPGAAPAAPQATPAATPSVKTGGATPAAPAATATPTPKAPNAPVVATTSKSPDAAAADAGQKGAMALITADIGGRDLQFLTNSIEHGRMLHYLCELAKDKAGTEQVKVIGGVLASAQDEENNKLARLAAMKGITASSDEPAGKKGVAAKLNKLSGPKLDKALMEEIIGASEKAVKTYEAAAKSQDEDIKAFVEQGLPLAKEKLLLVNKMGGNAPRGGNAPGFRTNVGAPGGE